MSQISASGQNFPTLVAKHPELAIGYEDIRFGRPFNYALCDTPAMFAPYEVGRQIAILFRQQLGYLPPFSKTPLPIIYRIYLVATRDQHIVNRVRLASGRYPTDAEIDAAVNSVARRAPAPRRRAPALALETLL